MALFEAQQQLSRAGVPNRPYLGQSTTNDSKEAVLDAAQKLIAQYGYTGFSMRDLAYESGLAKATLYHHFQDKREIFLQVLHRDLRIACDTIAAAAASPGDFQTRLRSITAAFFSLATERGVLLLSALRQAAGMEQEFCLLMHSYQDELQRPIVQLFNEAMAAGVIHVVDPDLAATGFLGMLHGFTSRHLLMNDLELDERLIEFALKLMLHGLLATPADDLS